MRYSLLDLLLLVFPFAFIAMAFRPADFESTPFEWQTFKLASLPENLDENRNVLVLVKSVYGGHATPEAVLKDLNGWVGFSTCVCLPIVSALALVGRVAYRIKRREKIAA